MKAALYARVSTRDQHLETQLQPLREYALRRGFEILEYSDFGVSGAKEHRAGLDQLMKAARLKQFDRVIVARFDRFARSVTHLLSALELFQSRDIAFESLSEGVDTATVTGRLVLTILGAVAEMERSIIAERRAAGIARARRDGVKFGAPKKIFDREKAKEMLKSSTVRKVAAAFGVSKSTIGNL